MGPQSSTSSGDRLIPVLVGYGLVAGLFTAACWVYVRGPRDTINPDAAPGVWTIRFGGVESSPSPFPALIIGAALGALAAYLLAQSLRSQGYYLKHGADARVSNLLILSIFLGLLTGLAAYANLAVNAPRRFWVAETTQPLIIDADPIWLTIPAIAVGSTLFFGGIASFWWRLGRNR